MKQLVEIILYRIKPGKGATFHQIMLNESIPLHNGAGIHVVESQQSAMDADCYCLIRSFESLAAYKHKLEQFYASAAWRDGPRQRIIDCIDMTSKAVLEMHDGQLNGKAEA